MELDGWKLERWPNKGKWGMEMWVALAKGELTFLLVREKFNPKFMH